MAQFPAIGAIRNDMQYLFRAPWLRPFIFSIRYSYGVQLPSGVIALCVPSQVCARPKTFFVPVNPDLNVMVKGTVAPVPDRVAAVLPPDSVHWLLLTLPAPFSPTVAAVLLSSLNSSNWLFPG